MSNKILICFNLVMILIKVQTKEIRSYSCNTAEKINEIKNSKTTFKKLIIHFDTLYFVFEKRIIFARLAFNDNDQYVNGLINYNFFEQDNDEIYFPQSIPKEYQIFGYEYNKKLNETKEYYFKDDSREDQKNPNHVYFQNYLLNFDQFKGQLTSRDKLIETSNLIELNSILNTKYFNIYRFEIDKLDLELIFRHFLEKSYDKNRQNFLSVKYLIRIKNFSELTDKITPVIYLDTKFNRPNIKFFTFFFKYSNGVKFMESHRIYFIEIDRSFNQINFVRCFFDYHIDRSLLTISNEIKFNFEELFNCHTKYKNENQIRGIYHSKDLRLFYIIINRFYLKLDEQIISNKFIIKDEHYANNASDLKFNIKMYISESNENYRWVKTIGPNLVLLVPDTGSHFELSTDSNANLVLNKLADLSKTRLESCNEQTLTIQNHVFCFKSKIYFYMYELNGVLSLNQTYQSSSIVSIFEDTSVLWDNYQDVKLIFNYDDKFVIMTSSHLFVFDYDKFKVIDKKLSSTYSESDKYLKLESYLFKSNFQKDPLNIMVYYLIGVSILISIFFIYFIIVHFRSKAQIKPYFLNTVKVKKNVQSCSAIVSHQKVKKSTNTHIKKHIRRT